jgi:broad specificity phosphatase PhoE
MAAEPEGPFSSLETGTMNFVRRAVAVAVMGVGVACTTTRTVAQEAVIIVRHAERLDDSDDAPLSPAGAERAAKLAGMLKDAGVKAVYATQYQRTQKTVEPMAKALGLTVKIVRSDDVAGLVARLRAEHANDVVVVAGHSDTAPKVLDAFGYSNTITIDHADYDNLFIVTPRSSGRPSVVRLHY